MQVISSFIYLFILFILIIILANGHYGQNLFHYFSFHGIMEFIYYFIII